jgi:CHAT domain-containing protein
VLEMFAQAILAPHAERIEALEPDDILVISVAGPLHRVPFAALPWAGRPLCERATPVVVQGFGMLEAALDRPRLALGSFALVGAPKRPDLDSLSGAAAEIDAISTLLAAAGREVQVFPGPRATVAALTEAAATHDGLHIACHAVADPSPEHASRLMLSPDLRHGDSGDLSEDRIISAIEVRPGGLVNLSGCATGRTRESNAPLLGGLVPAFLLAGAGTVIASLWPIADEPAATFQAELYRQLVGGARPAAALAGAQRRCARGDLGAEARETAVWAAHVAYGAG